MRVLKIDNISKSYGKNQALDRLSLNIEKTNIFGILGPNGSGKTTILAIILGVVKQNSGNFQWFDNQENTQLTERIGALLEMPNFYPYLSLYKNLRISAEIKKIENPDEEIEKVLNEVGLIERQYSKYNTLSLGMKQRLALASVLLGNPEILILDEPTNGLDPKGIADVREILIDQAKKGKTIIIASHILDEVQKTCSHIAILKKGKLLKLGRIDEILKSEKTITISSDNIDELYELIVRSGLSKKTIKINNELIITLEDKIQAKDINEFAFKNNFILNKFEERKISLESEFLKIVD
ncbi:MAG: ATP-binding cassette domain-containing protein [Bacteroidales bacterium]|nr:ATP-binding cassette domain-containing protein [Bacteroidales bacterium]MBN2758123.1 ATP-binding cassette domain-containing protein [Bacteroidales bacterium]